VDFNRRLHLQRDDFTIPYHHLAVDDGEFRALRGAEQRGGYGIVQRSGVANGVKVQREEIGAFADFQGTDVGTSKDSCSAQGGNLEGFSRGHPFVDPDRMRLGEQEMSSWSLRWEQTHLQTRQQHGLAGLEQNVRSIIAGRSVHPKANFHPGRQVFFDRRDTGTEPHIRTRAMGHSTSGLGELFDFLIIHMDCVREPHVLTEPAVGLHPIHWAELVPLESIPLLVARLAKMGVEFDFVLAGSAAESRNSEMVTENGEHGAKAIWVIAPGEVS
jgi:hypothetical protein